MRNIGWIVLLLIAGATSCSRRAHHQQVIYDSEKLADVAPDSALAKLNSVDVSDIKEDSLRALYYIVEASAHKAKEGSMAADSLTRFSFEYYRDRDLKRFLQSGDLYALHLFWSGRGKESLDLLDSMIALPGVPEELVIQLLQSRIGVGGAEFDCGRNISYIRRLQELDTDSVRRIEYTYQLCENYQFAGHRDSALILIDELIEHAYANGMGEDQFRYTYEKAGILEELGRYAESNRLIDYIMGNAPHNSAMPYLRFWKALNYFNLGDFDRSAHELAMADSCAIDRDDVQWDYYESFAGPMREFLAYRRDGVVKLTQLATLNNGQRDLFSRMESTRWETEQNALKQENRALILKAKNERKTAIIIIVALVAILMFLAAAWNSQKRKRKIIDAEERAEALQKMIDEMSGAASDAGVQESLRRAMLQQLGIIKMVAETPTEQNRELLRKISSIDSDTNGSLVNWADVYDMIDNLYSGFYSRLHKRYGEVLSGKEEQIIVLMLAGFSTKEIGVITAQTTATIYVRKSSVRKKLGVPEKEYIMAFLRKEESV